MAIGEYLQAKYNVQQPSSMLACEARVFGIGWPLKAGWWDRVNSFEITTHMQKSLDVALVNYTRQAERKAHKKTRKNINTDSVYKRLASADKAAELVKAMRAPDAVDPASKAFLMTPQWRKLRYEALKLYGCKCACCGVTPDSGAILNVDHIKPRKKFPALALEITNLQVLCAACNHGKGNWDSTDWRGQ